MEQLLVEKTEGAAISNLHENYLIYIKQQNYLFVMHRPKINV